MSTKSHLKAIETLGLVAEAKASGRTFEDSTDLAGYVIELYSECPELDAPLSARAEDLLMDALLELPEIKDAE